MRLWYTCHDKSPRRKSPVCRAPFLSVCWFKPLLESLLLTECKVITVLPLPVMAGTCHSSGQRILHSFNTNNARAPKEFVIIDLDGSGLLRLSLCESGIDRAHIPFVPRIGPKSSGACRCYQKEGPSLRIVCKQPLRVIAAICGHGLKEKEKRKGGKKQQKTLPAHETQKTIRRRNCK